LPLPLAACCGCLHGSGLMTPHAPLLCPAGCGLRGRAHSFHPDGEPRRRGGRCRSCGGSGGGARRAHGDRRSWGRPGRHGWGRAAHSWGHRNRQPRGGWPPGRRRQRERRQRERRQRERRQRQAWQRPCRGAGAVACPGPVWPHAARGHAGSPHLGSGGGSSW
jgi:hypothetical protein